MATLSRNIKTAIDEMNRRGLNFASRWLCELLYGIEGDPALSEDLARSAIYEHEENVFYYATSLLSTAEFQRCAFILKSHIAKHKQSTSHLLRFLLSYSLYMAGEKLKEQALAEQTADTSPALNPYLGEIFKELHTSYECSDMDAHMIYIFGIVVRDLHKQGGGPLELQDVPSSVELLFESVRHFPWNWSCWLEIIAAFEIEGGKDIPVLPSWMQTLTANIIQGTERGCDYLPHRLFLATVLIEQNKSQVAMQLLQDTQAVFPSAINICSQIAKAYYTLRDYDAAQECFEQSRVADPYRLENLDIFSNILYVKEKRSELSHLAHACVKINKFAPETSCIIGNYYSLKGHHEKAILNFQRAVKVNRQCLSAWTLMGHEYVELHNATAAVHCYRQAIDVNASDYRAWYGLGQTYEMLHLHQYALYYYKKATALRRHDPRMWCAVAKCLERLGSSGSRESLIRFKRDAVAAYERAVECNDREGLAVRELARLYREFGEKEKAVKCYSHFIEAKGADAEVDTELAEALLYVGIYYSSIDEETATAYCQRLIDYPGAEGAEAKAVLRNMKHIYVEHTANNSSIFSVNTSFDMVEE